MKATARITEIMSPSMRREWIEIILCADPYFKAASPSMRREWIEM